MRLVLGLHLRCLLQSLVSCWLLCPCCHTLSGALCTDGQPDKQPRLKSFSKHLHESLEGENALRDRLATLQKDLRKLVSATADGDRKSTGEIDKLLEVRPH